MRRCCLGARISSWQTNTWRVRDGVIEAGAGNLPTKESFGDMQLHLEWLAPADFEGPWYNRGNNGVLLMGLYEIQIFDSYNEKLYPDGQTASVYGQTPPRVNASRPPGQWQTFDIVFTAPRWEGDRLASPARVTMFHNGVLVHLEEEIRGETNHRVVPEYRRRVSQGPLVLGGHDCPVQFRNIWVRPLRTRIDRGANLEQRLIRPDDFWRVPIAAGTAAPKPAPGNHKPHGRPPA